MHDISVGIHDVNAYIILKKVRTQLRKAVKVVKQDYYQKMLKGQDHKNIFQAVQCPSSIKQYTTFLIQKQDEILAVDNLAKQKVLKEALFTPSLLDNFFL